MTFFIEFDDVDEFSATAVGEPGSRVFFLNAKSGDERVSVRCEKQQVKAIATYLRQVLSDLPPPESRPMLSAEGTPPGDEAFVLGPIGLGYDRSNDRLLVQLEEMVEADLLATEADDAEEVLETGELTEVESLERGHIRFYITRSQADAFCDHADRIVAAGRPQCVWCGNPVDPDGHPCPRMN
jgi:uncharacterized repeat protein (TIGR03847 family)